jgi:hypothetical protein
MLRAFISENGILKHSTRCLLDHPTDGYNRPSGQEKKAEQVELAKLRRHQTEEAQNR